MKVYAFVLLPAFFLMAQTAAEVEITAEPHHHQILANESVRAFYVELAPHSDTLMHWHRHDYIYVTLGAGEAVSAAKGAEPIVVKVNDGETQLVAGNFAHVAHNVTDKMFRNVTVEVMQDEKLRQDATAGRIKWDEERGVDILHGGTKEILWVKDGVRASEFELQPGGMVPLHHHAGPHLVVAVTDLKFHSEVEGKGTSEVQLKSGEAKWVPGGFSHTLMNSGSAPAKWVTLEFP